MPKSDDELKVIDLTLDLLVWIGEHVAKFPRAHRHSIGLRLDAAWKLAG